MPDCTHGRSGGFRAAGIVGESAAVNRLVGILRNRIEDAGEVLAEARNGGLAKQVGRVFAYATQFFILFVHVQREVQLRGHRLIIDPRHLDFRQSQQLARETLKRQRGLHQRLIGKVSARLQPGNQALERHFRVGIRLEARVPHLAQELPECRISRQVSAQRKGVGQKAYDALVLCPATPGDWRAHHDVGLPAPAGEQRLERREHHHEHGGALLQGQLAQFHAGRPRRTKRPAGASRAGDRRPRPVCRQLKQGWRTAQSFGPISRILLQAVALQSHALTARKVRVPESRWGRDCGGVTRIVAVQRAQLRNQHAVQ